jgi:hypothetical protein
MTTLGPSSPSPQPQRQIVARIPIRLLSRRRSRCRHLRDVEPHSLQAAIETGLGFASEGTAGGRRRLKRDHAAVHHPGGYARRPDR